MYTTMIYTIIAGTLAQLCHSGSLCAVQVDSMAAGYWVPEDAYYVQVSGSALEQAGVSARRVLAEPWERKYKVTGTCR